MTDADDAVMVVRAPAAAVEARPSPPAFAIVIAAYQAESVIGEAVASALAQTVPAAEIVVCDDGSTDGTAAALEAFGDAIRVVRQANGGEAAAKNRAIREATAEFVVVLDADDRFEPERLEALGRAACLRPDLDVITTDAWLEVDGRRVRRVYDASNPFEVDDQRAEILRRNFVFGHAAVRRARVLEEGGYDEAIRVTTDWDLWIRMVLGGSRIGVVPRPLASYRMLGSSLSADATAVLAGRIETLTKTAADPALTDEERASVRRRIAGWERELAVDRARVALLERRPDARRRAWQIATTTEQPPWSRAKAAVAAVSPGVARSLLRRPSAQARRAAGSRLGAAAGAGAVPKRVGRARR